MVYFFSFEFIKPGYDNISDKHGNDYYYQIDQIFR